MSDDLVARVRRAVGEDKTGLSRTLTKLCDEIDRLREAITKAINDYPCYENTSEILRAALAPRLRRDD